MDDEEAQDTKKHPTGVALRAVVATVAVVVESQDAGQLRSVLDPVQGDGSPDEALLPTERFADVELVNIGVEVGISDKSISLLSE